MDLTPSQRNGLKSQTDFALHSPQLHPHREIESDVSPIFRASSSSPLQLLMQLSSEIVADIERGLDKKLLALNQSRREALAQYLLDISSRQKPVSPQRAPRDLSSWLATESNEADRAALHTFVSELALIWIGKTILLKRWADLAGQPFTSTLLQDANWHVSEGLKKHQPLLREGWQLTSRNLFSWYTPSVRLLERTLEVLQAIPLQSEPVSLLAQFLSAGRGTRVHGTTGYDPRFFEAAWNFLADWKSAASFRETPQQIFSPTLRNGSFLRTTPQNWIWSGTESQKTDLISAELMVLWDGPRAPPLWAYGSGLSLYGQEQLSLVSSGPKRSTLSSLREISGFDGAVILEEQVVRLGEKNHEAQELKREVDDHPFLRKYRQAGASQGAFQALVATHKVRAGGWILWARNEPIDSREPNPLLAGILGRCKLIAEWDFSHFTHTLPTEIPLYPRFLYLLEREVSLERRSLHRPLRIQIRGTIRSHVELQTLLRDSLAAHAGEPQSRECWNAFRHESPIPQQEWMEGWPEALTLEKLENLARLKSLSLPLGDLAVFKASGSARPLEEAEFSLQSRWDIQSSPGYLLKTEGTGPRQTLRVLAPKIGQNSPSGIFVWAKDPANLSLVLAYCRSRIFRDWVEHHAEQKNGKWQLSESLLRQAPVPKALFEQEKNRDPSIRERCLGFLKEGAEISPSDPEFQALSIPLYWTAADLWVDLTSNLSALERILPEGNTEREGIEWLELLKLLPVSERSPVHQHPGFECVGMLPEDAYIEEVIPISAPALEIRLKLSSGVMLRIRNRSPEPLFHEALLGSLKALPKKTWGEIKKQIALPRSVNQLEKTAEEIVQFKKEQMKALARAEQVLDSALAGWLANP